MFLSRILSTTVSMYWRNERNNLNSILNYKSIDMNNDIILMGLIA